MDCPSDNTKFFLAGDVTGLCSGHFYGKAGEQVTLVADHGNVMIVEKEGKRFPADCAMLSPVVVERKEEVELKEVIKPVTIKSRTKAKPRSNTNHSSLF